MLATGTEVEFLSTTSPGGQAGIKLTGNGYAQSITGNAGNNVVDGRGGADTMTGLAGNDTYFVDHAGDVVVEQGGGGTVDRILASVSHAISINSEIEILTTTDASGTAAINLTGSNHRQSIAGNAGSNVLYGLGGNDTLNGGLGADTMYGGTGDDTYYVDNALDIVSELNGFGIDTVYSSVDFVLGAGLDHGKLTGDGDIDLTGTDINNNLQGNAGANVITAGGGDDYLNGGLGADTLIGGAGNDRIFVNELGDIVDETVGGGTDTVRASATYVLSAGAEIEIIETTGAAAIDLTGNEFGQTLRGNNGANVLNGREGTDTLTGLGGADAFFFNTTLGAANIDHITDYNVAQDTIWLENAIFAGLAAGALASGAFNTGAAATQADDRIIYSAATGALIFDADGLNGSAGIQFATLGAGLGLTSADFVVV